MIILLMFTIAFNCNAQTKLKNDKVIDIDGNVYTTIKIGNQIWTIENYKATRYRDGTPIPLVTDSKKWSIMSAPSKAGVDKLGEQQIQPE
jgi:hypothetical protein